MNNSTTVFLDLKKAFDTKSLAAVEKSESFGFRGQVLSWFSLYLKSRTQCLWKNEISTELKVKNDSKQIVLFWVQYCLYCTLLTLWTLVKYPFRIADETSILFK